MKVYVAVWIIDKKWHSSHYATIYKFDKLHLFMLLYKFLTFFIMKFKKVKDCVIRL